ncbi:hypothetical protein KSS87_009273 [Heliosperma pusillum]|nr:hypothetical protein KSS87_009273 [Heliosperma pusillum]
MFSSLCCGLDVLDVGTGFRNGASPSAQDDGLKAFLSKSISGNSTLSASGKASDQPKRTPLSKEEIEAVLLGGCF